LAPQLPGPLRAGPAGLLVVGLPGGALGASMPLGAHPNPQLSSVTVKGAPEAKPGE